MAQIYRNLTPAQLIEYALTKGEGVLSSTGALVVTTGKYTGRSPKDKYIVDTPGIHNKIAWGNGMLFLLLLIPFVNFIVGIITINKISKSFGYGIGFTLGLIFVPLIFYPILAFGRSRYLGVVNY